jgi:hypothetical protein
MVLNDFSPHLIHEKLVEILTEISFCVLEGNVLSRLECSDSIEDHDHQMVRLTPEMVESAVGSLPKNVKLYDRILRGIEIDRGILEHHAGLNWTPSRPRTIIGKTDHGGVCWLYYGRNCC